MNQENRPPEIIHAEFKTTVEVCQAFIPFFKNKGIFIPTSKPLVMGRKVMMVLIVPNEGQMAAAGTVAWINPRNSMLKAPQGVGVEFDAQYGEVVQKLTRVFFGISKTDHPSYTM